MTFHFSFISSPPLLEDNHLSIYISDIFSLKGGSQDKAFRVQGNFILPSPSAPCLFIGENSLEVLPRPLAPSLLVAFYESQKILLEYLQPHHNHIYTKKYNCNTSRGPPDHYICCPSLSLCSLHRPSILSWVIMDDVPDHSSREYILCCSLGQ